jgi:hypothetical protein
MTSIVLIALLMQAVFGGKVDLAPIAAASYTAYTAGFDGSNDYLTEDSGVPLAGASDGKLITFSVWLDFTGGDATQQTIMWMESDRWLVEKTTGNAIHVVGRTTGGTVALDATTSVTKTASDGWFHLFLTVNMQNSSERHIYFDGTEDSSVTWTTYSNSNLDITRNINRVGAAGSGLLKINASMAELWFDDTYNDTPTAFRESSKPKDLGADGSTPTGTSPVLYLSRTGSGNSWADDTSSNDNNFTVTGTLGSPTAP